MSKITDYLSCVKIGEAITHENMRVYPLFSKNGHTRGYRTLDEALDAEELVVEELNEGGSVPTLKVKNTGKLPVLMVIGEELVGAKQNRTLNTSVLVPAKSEMEIPVSCVERGRWAYSSRAFSKSDFTDSMRLRREKTGHVTENLRSTSSFSTDQGKVWREVDRTMSSHGSSSPTSSLHDVYEHIKPQIKEYMEALKLPECEGMLVEINGRIVGCDLFDHAETFEKLRKKLLRGYVINAIERKRQKAKSDSGDTKQFLEAAKKAAEEIFDSVGLGKDVRISSDDISGSSLLWEERPVHTSLFSLER